MYENDSYVKGVAQRLARQMQDYEQEVIRGAVNATDCFFGSSWRDKKSSEFSRAYETVVKDMQNGVQVMSRYRKHLEDKIRNF